MKPIRGSRRTSQDNQNNRSMHHPSSRNLQKVTLNFNATDDTTADSNTPNKVPLQTTPLPFQQSQSLCPGSQVYGYTALSALRDDLRVYFEIINGPATTLLPPGESQTTGTEGTAVAPPVFETTPGTVGATLSAGGSTVVGTGAASSGATGDVVTDENSTLADMNMNVTLTDDMNDTLTDANETSVQSGTAPTSIAGMNMNGTLTDGMNDTLTDTNDTLTDANETSVQSGTTPTSIAGVVSTTVPGGTGPADALTTAPADNGAALSPEARKRIRSHFWEGRRTEDASNGTSTDWNSTDVGGSGGDENGTLTEDLTADNTTDWGSNLTSTPTDNLTDWDANLTTTSLSTVPGASNTTDGAAASMGAGSNPDLSVDFEIEPSVPVQFNVCPGVFDFESSDGWGEDPLVIEALTRNPVWIRCVDEGASSGGVADAAPGETAGNGTAAASDASAGDVAAAPSKRNLAESACIFSGGLMHISFNSHGSSSTADNDTGRRAGQDPQLHPLTISGISFQKASQAALSMHDPRGEINFEDCEFTMNEAASMVIDGRYEGTPGAPGGAAATGGGAAFDGSSFTGDGGRYTESDDTLQQFYQENSTPAPVTARPSPNPDSPDPPTTPYPTTGLRIPIQPTTSPHPTVAANKLYPPPEPGGYSGPPTLASAEENVTDTDPTSFLLPSTVGSGTTAFVDSSTTWSGFMGTSTFTTQSTSFGYNGTDDDADDFMAEPIGEDGGDESEEWGDMNMTTTPPPLGRRELDSSYYSDTDLFSYEVMDEARFLLSSIPKAIVKIKSCVFHDNVGTASIIMTSYFGDMDTSDAGVLGQNDDVFSARALAEDVPMAHSVHLSLENTRFESEDVDQSIVIDGGRLQTEECVFTNISADTIINIESGTLAMSQTEFTDNTVKSGLVEIGEGSSLESNDNNCDTTDASSAVESDSDVDVPVSSRYLQEDESNSTTASSTHLNATGSEAIPISTNTSGLSAVPVSGPAAGVSPASSTTCHGIYSDGICRKFGDSCAAEGELGMPEGCLSTWDELVTAVKERLDDERDFVICPMSTMDIEASAAQSPVVIDSEYITIKCGENGTLDEQCVIVGGYSQFQIVGSASGVELSGLKMMSSRGSSIIAAGTKEATLHLKNCEWDSNVGESAVLIQSGPPSELALDMSQLMSAAGGETMSVEIDACIFRKNSLLFGTITNIGGTLTVYKTLFEGNTGAKGGDIVTTNGGSLKVQESCFDESKSTAPGTIFVDFNSSMPTNNNNFGRNNTSVGGECTAAFLEAEGKSCLTNPAMCDGMCMNFTSTTCTLPMFDKFIYGPVNSTPVSTPAGATPVLGETAPSEPQESSNLIPIIVASVVAAFVVFGMGGIIWHRKKKGRRGGGGGGDTDVVRSSTMNNPLESNPFASMSARRSKQAHRGDEMDDAYDGLDDIDEEDN